MLPGQQASIADNLALGVRPYEQLRPRLDQHRIRQRGGELADLGRSLREPRGHRLDTERYAQRVQRLLIEQLLERPRGRLEETEVFAQFVRVIGDDPGRLVVAGIQHVTWLALSERDQPFNEQLELGNRRTLDPPGGVARPASGVQKIATRDRDGNPQGPERPDGRQRAAVARHRGQERGKTRRCDHLPDGDR